MAENCNHCGRPLRWGGPGKLRVGLPGSRAWNDPTEARYHKSCLVVTLMHQDHIRRTLAVPQEKGDTPHG